MYIVMANVLISLRDKQDEGCIISTEGALEDLYIPSKSDLNSSLSLIESQQGSISLGFI